ncbi:unnamed protein product, partial [Effrenium voratum]
MRGWGECDHEGKEVKELRGPKAAKPPAKPGKAHSAFLDEELDKYFEKETPEPCVESLSPAEMQDRKVAAMLLRSARHKVEQAEESGLAAYLEEEAHLDQRVNKRLLAGEVSQARSFNRRAGIEPLPAVQEPSAGLSLEQREAKALEQEYVRSSHRMRSSEAVAVCSAQPRKRQRVGTQGEPLDVAALEEEAKKQADEDAALVNPILRPPPKLVKRIAVKIGGKEQFPPPIEGLLPKTRESMEEMEAKLWPSKGMRVRVFNETGE